MQIFDFENNEKELSFINNDFPFSFTKDFSTYVTSQNNKLIFIKNNSFIIPGILKKSKFLKILQFQFKPLSIGSNTIDIENEKEFIEQVYKFIKNKKLVDRIIQPANYCLFQNYLNESTYCEFGTFQINLESNSIEQLLLNMQPRYRTSIRATMALKPEIRVGLNELLPFWNLHKETLLRTNMYFEPIEELQNILNLMPSNTLVANIYLNNEIQGGVFITYSNYAGFYLHGASSHTSESDGVIKYLHYWCMCHLKQLGVKKYDFVGARTSNVNGTKLEGIQNFKKRLGGELIKGYLWKKDISPYICWAYDSLLLLKLKLKGKKVPLDIIEQENIK